MGIAHWLSSQIDGRALHYGGLLWCCAQAGMLEPAEDVLVRHAPQHLGHGIDNPGLATGDHGRGRSRDNDPDQFDSTGPCTRAIRLTRLAASAARLNSEYLARGAEHVASL